MLDAKQRNMKVRSNSKSKSSLPRLRSVEDLPKFIQPLQPPKTSGQKQRHRRSKAEIVQELRRLHQRHNEDKAKAKDADDDDDEMKRRIVAPVSSAAVHPIRSLKELDALRLTRHRLEQLLNCCNSFEQAVLNCFVRVNINEANVLPEHRIGQIISVVEQPMGYYVGKTPTNIVLQLRYDDLVVQHELNDISNMAFTPKEFSFWYDNCICQNIDFPTNAFVTLKKIEWYNTFNSGIKVNNVLKQDDLIGFTMPMRAKPKGGLLERLGGGVYPWKLQRPEPPLPSPSEEEDGEEAQLLLESTERTD